MRAESFHSHFPPAAGRDRVSCVNERLQLRVKKAEPSLAQAGKGPTSEQRALGGRKVEPRCALWELEQWVRLAGACDDRSGLGAWPSSPPTPTEGEWSHHRKYTQKGVVMCHCVWRADGDVEGGAALMCCYCCCY